MGILVILFSLMISAESRASQICPTYLEDLSKRHASVVTINYGDDAGYGQVTVISDNPMKEEESNPRDRPEIGEYPEPALQIITPTETNVDTTAVPGVHFPIPEENQTPDQKEELPN